MGIYSFIIKHLSAVSTVPAAALGFPPLGQALAQEDRDLIRGWKVQAHVHLFPQQILDHLEQAGLVDRLFHVFGRPEGRQSLVAVLGPAVEPGDDDDGDAAAGVLDDPLGQVEAVKPGQDSLQDDQIGPLDLVLLPGGKPIHGRPHGEADRLEKGGQPVQGPLVVIDEEDLLVGHGIRIVTQPPRKFNSPSDYDILARMNAVAPVRLSVIVPAYNEERNIPRMVEELTAACLKLAVPYEVIFIDDGSKDGTFEALRAAHAKDERIKVIRFRKNFGQTAAMSAGFDYARGEIVVTIDGDLENDPGDIGTLLAKIEEGYDLVSGWRKDRWKKHFFSRRLPSLMANWLISRITKVKLRDYGCTLKAYRREVVKNIRLYGEMHRFIPAIAATIGVRIAEVPVNFRPRIHGASKYGFSRSIRVFLDLLTVKFLLSYSTRPLQIFGLLGLVSGGVGGVLGLVLSYQRLVLKQGISNRPLLLLAILLIVIGFQFITMGLLGEIMVRTYHEAVEKRIYVARDLLGVGEDEA
jgi:glycosyltransferase involved in cell wall biosynthesis